MKKWITVISLLLLGVQTFGASTSGHNRRLHHQPVGGGGLLLGTLEAWWENADVADQHNGHTFAFTPGTAVAGPVAGINAWDIDTFGNGVLLWNWEKLEVTIAFVSRSPTQAHCYFTNTDGLTNGRMVSTNGQNLFINYPGIPQTGLGDIFSPDDWESTVLTVSADAVRFYLNGVLLSTTPNTNPGGTSNFVIRWFAENAGGARLFEGDVAIVAVSESTAWNQAQVDEFHNGGDFQRYIDL